MLASATLSTARASPSAAAARNAGAAAARRGAVAATCHHRDDRRDDVVVVAAGRRLFLGASSSALLLSRATPAVARDDGDDDDAPKAYSDYNSGVAAADEAPQSELVKRLLAKSAENKEANDRYAHGIPPLSSSHSLDPTTSTPSSTSLRNRERKNYDKQYAGNMAILKGSGYVPKDESTREKMGITRPAECDLPFFRESETCKLFVK